jgi:hypothetical protein
MKAFSESSQCRWHRFQLPSAWTATLTLAATVGGPMVFDRPEVIGLAPAHSFEPPPSEGTPVRTIGGGTRSGSNACRPPIPAGALIVPHPEAPAPESRPSQSVSRFLGGQASQSVLVYLPATGATQLEFSLFDRAGNGRYQTLIAAPAAAAVVDLPAPAPAPGDYWTVALVCNPRDRTQDWVISGALVSARSAGPSAPAAALRLILLTSPDSMVQALPSPVEAAVQ